MLLIHSLLTYLDQREKKTQIVDTIKIHKSTVILLIYCYHRIQISVENELIYSIHVVARVINCVFK